MNIREALEKRIPRIRKPEWANPESYVRLPLLPDDKYGPWAELYDDTVQRDVLDITPGSQKFCVFLQDVANDDGYEEYTGTPSQYEAENYAKVYLES